MANNLTFNQLATVLTAVTEQATGVKPIAVVDTSTFVTVGQIALKSGYDNVINAISQVLSKTVFSNRPYKGKFGGLMVDAQRWGNHVRKLSVVDKPFENDDRLPLTDGESVDQQKVNKPDVVQTNFYGAEVYQKSLTMFKDQLDVAFSSPAEFSSFISMVLTNVSDQIEQSHEVTKRMCIANLAGAVHASGKPAQIVKLVTMYNEKFGTELTAESVMLPENFDNFVTFAYSTMKTASDMMTERSSIYHKKIGSKDVMRHTPYKNQKFYMNTDFSNDVSMRVFSNVFNDSYLKEVDFEKVNFWQSIDSHMDINITPATIGNDGNFAKGVAQNFPLVAMIFDEEAAGVTCVNQWTASAPFNARGGYTNTFWHFTDRYWNDFSENCVIFTLE